MGSIKGDKQCRITVRTAIQIILQVQFGFGIEIHSALLVALAEYHTFSSFKIHISNIQIDQFTHTNTCGIQQINHSQISRTGTMIAQLLDRFIRNNLLDLLFGFDFVNPSHGTFQNVVFFLQPGEKARNISADIIYRDLSTAVDLLITRKITADFLRIHFADRRGNAAQQVLHRYTVILQCAFRAAFDFLGIEEHLQIFCVRYLGFVCFGFRKVLEQYLLQFFHLRNAQIFSHFVQNMH